MAKRLALIVAMLLFIPALARADNFLQYNYVATWGAENPSAYYGIPSSPADLETISLSFIRETTAPYPPNTGCCILPTDKFFDIHLVATGPWAPGLTGAQPSNIAYGALDFAGPTSGLQAWYINEGDPLISLYFSCDGCNPDESRLGNQITTTITLLGDPVSTPEPNSLLLLGAGLAALALAIHARANRWTVG
jgi:hypothetical protein